MKFVEAGGHTDGHATPDTPRFRALPEVEAYWHGLRKNGDIPLRSAVDPRGIQRALAHSFILEEVAPGLARIRIAGSGLSGLMGTEVRGMPVSSLISVKSRALFGRILGQVLAEPASARLSFEAKSSDKSDPVSGQMLLLPLRSDTGHVPRILGCLQYRGTPGRAPCRLDLTSSLLRKLTPQTGDWIARPQPSQPVLVASQDFLPAQQEHRPQRKQPALRLIVNER